MTTQWNIFNNNQEDNGGPIESITITEIKSALKVLKKGKAPGYDKLFSEFLIHLGLAAQRWLAKFLTRIVTEKQFPKTRRTAKIVALLKPGKDPKQASLPTYFTSLSVL